MPLFLIPWAVAAIGGAAGWSWLTSEDTPEAPVTVAERQKSRRWWGVVALAAILGGVWLWKRK